MTHPLISIRFPQGRFAELRKRLLEDLDRETFALLLAKREEAGEQILLKVLDTRTLRPSDYDHRGLAYLRPKREFIHRVLAEMQVRHDVDTLIDVHTHPFCRGKVAFSGVDDRDEASFCRWLAETLDGVTYASIVLSQTEYSARLWRIRNGTPMATIAFIKTQTVLENWPSSDESLCPDRDIEEAADQTSGFLARSALALGLDTLRKLMHNQSIAVIGLGGLGSVIAENLIHMGFRSLHLIDPDRVEVTNLNRIAGAYYQDAIQHRLKVDVVRQHLLQINPKASVQAYASDVREEGILPVLANADWILLATDNQSSRFRTQRIAQRFFVPLISAGVGIRVEDGRIADMSGEVIITRTGDGLCLQCLGRINPTRVAAEEQAGRHLGNELVTRGYARGCEIKEPAVKTLNAIVGAMTVEVLLNQYAERQPHTAILVYENNTAMAIYADTLSVQSRNTQCFACGIF